MDMDPLEEVRNSVSPKLKYAKFDNVNLSNNDLSVINLRHSEIIDSNLTNTSLKNSDLSFSKSASRFFILFFEVRARGWEWRQSAQLDELSRLEQ